MGADVTVGISGTGGGFERFCVGETDLSNASREIDEEEASACESNGVEYVEIQVAVDALTNVINLENDWTSCLDGRPAEGDLGAALQDLELESGRLAPSPMYRSSSTALERTPGRSTTSLT